MQLAIPRRLETIREHQQQGGSIAAIFPIHYSRALLRAFDLPPIKVWGLPGLDGGYGAAHLQRYVCSIVHNALSFLLTGKLELAEDLIVPHAFDLHQELGRFLIGFVKSKQRINPQFLPRGRDYHLLPAESNPKKSA